MDDQTNPDNAKSDEDLSDGRQDDPDDISEDKDLSAACDAVVAPSQDPNIDDNISNLDEVPSISDDDAQSAQLQDFTATDDQLLTCLMMVTKLFGKPLSSSTLLAGLPLHDECLTPDLLIRAAESVDISAQISQRQLSQFTPAVLPAILLLHNDEACVLVDITDEGDLVVCQPHISETNKTLSAASLSEIYSGYAVLLQPTYQYGKQTSEHIKVKSENWFWRVIRQYKASYSQVLLASFFINLFALSMPLFVMNVYDRVVPNHAMETLWVLVIGVTVVFCFDFILKILRSYYIDTTSKNIDVQLSSHIFQQLLDLKMAVRPKSVGSLTNTVQAFKAFCDFISSASVNVLVDVPFALLFLTIIAIIGGPLVLIPIAVIPIVIIANMILQKSITAEVNKQYNCIADRQNTLFESLNCIETVKTTVAENIQQAKWERSTCENAKNTAKLRSIACFGINFTLLIQQLASVGIVGVGVYLIMHHQLTVGALIACTILTGRALAPLSQIAGLYNQYIQSKTALSAVDNIMQGAVERPKDKVYLQRDNFSGSIEFKHVNFAYPEQRILTLNDISFKINPGDRVGLIGRIGSGKSSIEKLIMGLYEPTRGNILFDGTDISQLDITEIRRSIGHVPQNIMLFSGSVRDNITYASPRVSDAQLMRAMMLSGVDKFVNLHPDGLDMQVGERGDNISGGQRQSIAIARALLMDPDILLFDEPGNSMDDKTEREFKHHLTEILDEKTLIIITHKASMLSLCNRVIILEMGKIIADGPKELVLNALSQGKIKVKS